MRPPIDVPHVGWISIRFLLFLVFLNLVSLQQRQHVHVTSFVLRTVSCHRHGFCNDERRSSRLHDSNKNNNSGVVSGVTSELISQLAIVALKIRLEAHDGVQCRVTANTGDMAWRGRVGPVTVQGKGWESPLRLTCRAIEATVQECELDFVRVVRDKKLKLTVPAKGSAMIALNPTDFGNFITHPLLTPPKHTLIDGSPPDRIEFRKGNVDIDPPSGCVRFDGTFRGWPLRLTLSRGDGGGGATSADVRVELVDAGNRNEDGDSAATALDEVSRDALEADLSRLVSRYFSDLVFELDGTFLSYRDMMVKVDGKSAAAAAKGQQQKQRQPIVMMALTITVKKFPSPGVAF